MHFHCTSNQWPTMRKRTPRHTQRCRTFEINFRQVSLSVGKEFTFYTRLCFFPVYRAQNAPRDIWTSRLGGLSCGCLVGVRYLERLAYPSGFGHLERQEFLTYVYEPAGVQQIPRPRRGRDDITLDVRTVTERNRSTNLEVKLTLLVTSRADGISLISQRKAFSGFPLYLESTPKNGVLGEGGLYGRNLVDNCWFFEF